MVSLTEVIVVFNYSNKIESKSNFGVKSCVYYSQWKVLSLKRIFQK